MKLIIPPRLQPYLDSVLYYCPAWVTWGMAETGEVFFAPHDLTGPQMCALEQKGCKLVPLV